MLGGGSGAPVRAQWVGQADGLRQRQPKSAAEDECGANMPDIIVCIYCRPPRSVCQRLEQRIAPVLIELDVELGRHLV